MAKKEKKPLPETAAAPNAPEKAKDAAAEPQADPAPKGSHKEKAEGEEELPSLKHVLEGHHFREKRRYAAAVPLGGLFVVLALIGLITVVSFSIQMTERLIDNSKQKEMFEDIILPVTMFDPVPFEDASEINELSILRSSVWSAIIQNRDKYTVINENNMVMVPQTDVDAACAQLFGPEITLNHQSFDDYINTYSYDAESKMYYVPVDASVSYTPKVTEITRDGDTYELMVGYMAPQSQWMASIKGEKEDPVPSKYMIYVLKKVDSHYQLMSIQDPPEGAIPEQEQYHTENTADQAIQPVQPAEPQPADPILPEETEPETGTDTPETPTDEIV